jgi:hypothetical protein
MVVTLGRALRVLEKDVGFRIRRSLGEEVFDDGVHGTRLRRRHLLPVRRLRVQGARVRIYGQGF